MGLNPSGMGERYGWNYSNPNQPGYSTELIGTVCMIQEVQASRYGTRPPQPDFWPDGNPKMNIRMILCGPNGGIRTFTFQPASKAARNGEKRSVHLDLFALSDGDMMNLIGQTIKITTQPGQYGAGNPRPWEVALVTDQGPYMYNGTLPEEFQQAKVLMNNAVHGGQVQAPAQVAQPQMQPQMQPMQQQYQQQPMQQQPVQQPLQQYAQANMMDQQAMYSDIPF